MLAYPKQPRLRGATGTDRDDFICRRVLFNAEGSLQCGRSQHVTDRKALANIVAGSVQYRKSQLATYGTNCRRVFFFRVEMLAYSQKPPLHGAPSAERDDFICRCDLFGTLSQRLERLNNISQSSCAWEDRAPEVASLCVPVNQNLMRNASCKGLAVTQTNSLLACLGAEVFALAHPVNGSEFCKRVSFCASGVVQELHLVLFA